MADKNKRLAGNAGGPWYVDDTCIGCEACVAEAPGVFEMRDGLAVVKAQPADDSAKAAAESAQSACPVEAIGNDA
jgi:ferredoxin